MTVSSPPPSHVHTWAWWWCHRTFSSSPCGWQTGRRKHMLLMVLFQMSEVSSVWYQPAPHASAKYVEDRMRKTRQPGRAHQLEGKRQNVPFCNGILDQSHMTHFRWSFFLTLNHKRMEFKYVIWCQLYCSGLWFHSVAVSTSASETESPGFDSTYPRWCLLCAAVT